MFFGLKLNNIYWVMSELSTKTKEPREKGNEFGNKKMRGRKIINLRPSLNS